MCNAKIQGPSLGYPFLMQPVVWVNLKASVKLIFQMAP